MSEFTVYIIYHKGCSDGCAAALFVENFLKEEEVENIILVASSHNDKYEIPDSITGQIAVLVDFVYNQPNMEILLEKAHSVFVIDHHQTAIEMVEKLTHDKLRTLITNKKAASRLAWEIFNPDAELPQYVEYIDDYDTGKDRIPQALLLKHYMGRHHGMTPDFFREPDFDKWMEEGRAILESIEKRAKNVYENQLKIYEFEEEKVKYSVMVVYNDMDVMNYFNDAFGEDVDIILYLRQNYKDRSVKVSARAKRPHVNLLNITFWHGLILKGHIRAAAGIIHDVFSNLERDFINVIFKKKISTRPAWRSLSAELAL